MTDVGNSGRVIFTADENKKSSADEGRYNKLCKLNATKMAAGEWH